MPRRKNKTPRLPRGCGGISSITQSGTVDVNHTEWHDLDVPIVATKNSTLDASLFWHQHQPILQRLYSTGYSVVALSHTVFGKMDLQRDAASNRFPSPLTFPRRTTTSKQAENSTDETNTPISSNKPSSNFRILKRLNVVLEQVSDLTYYSLPLYAKSNTPTSIHSNNSTKNPYHEFLKEYDIIAISPRNDTVFSTLCTTAHLLWFHVLTLDYTTGRGGVQLPFTIKSSPVSSAISHGITFDVPYSPAIMDSNKRKAFVQAVKQFQTAVMAKTSSCTLPLVLCSGSRRRNMSSSGGIQDDVGPMALRQPGDLRNFCKVVLGLSDAMAGKLMKDHAYRVLERGQGWNMNPTMTRGKTGTRVGYQVSIVKLKDEGLSEVKQKNRRNDDMEETNKSKKRSKVDEVSMSSEKPKQNEYVEEDEEDMDDGFLRLS